MRFGPVPIGEALGGVVAHAVRAPGLSLKKGVRLGPADIAALAAAGVSTVTVALFDADDVPEDEAAGRIAAAVAGPSVRVDRAFTGRANLFAAEAGVLVVDPAGVDRINRLDEAVTFATLPGFRPVVEGEMIATVKIIPYAAPAAAVEAAETAGPLARVAPYRVKRVGIVSTLLAGLKPSVVDKTLAVTAERLKPSGAAIVADVRVPHEFEALAAAIAARLRAGDELIVIFGASAISDRRDVIPAAVEKAGGVVEHLGMPVDPGNLMMLGRIGATPVLGAPGCARSPKENGFDWVLARLLAGVAVTRADVTGMGVGGLLMEIVSRPQPRAGAPAVLRAPRIGAVVLAAGRSSRMGGPNKLLATIDGEPLVAHAVKAALAAGLSDVVVVTGHQGERVEAALAGLPVTFAANPDYAQGLSTSLKAGLAALPAEVDGAVVLLGDMPRVSGGLIGKLVAAFDPTRPATIVAPVAEGRRGNPVLWGRPFFADLARVTGDQGGRGLLATHADAVVEVNAEDGAIHLDLDTPEALSAAGGRISD